MYYDPKVSIWMSVDPLMEKYPASNAYAYCFNNPVKYIDPTGMEGESAGDPPAGKWYGSDIFKLFRIATYVYENDDPSDLTGNNCSMCCLNAFKTNLNSLYGEKNTKEVRVDKIMSTALQPLIDKGYVSSKIALPAISNGERITSKSSNVTDISINLGETLNNMTEEGSIGVFAVGIAQEYHSTIIVVMKNIKLPLLGKISNFSFVEDAGGVRHFTASGLNSKVSEFLIGAYNYYRGARTVGGKSITPGATFDLDTIIYQLYRP